MRVKEKEIERCRVGRVKNWSMGNGLVKRLRAKSIFKERDENINCQSLLQEMSNKISRGDSSNEPNVVCLDL